MLTFFLHITGFSVSIGIHGMCPGIPLSSTCLVGVTGSWQPSCIGALGASSHTWGLLRAAEITQGEGIAVSGGEQEPV